MKIAMQPFFSQQNKATGKFLLDGCLTVRICKFLAERLRDEDFEVEIFLPNSQQCESRVHVPGCWTRYRCMPQSTPRMLSNKLQRLDFDASWWEDALQDVDLLITCNELLSAKVKHVFGGKVISLNNLFPMGGWEWMEGLQREAWRSADLTAFMSNFIRANFDKADGRFAIWPMVYDANKIQQSTVKDVDVLFVQRCSASNYTHHEEFIQALEHLQGLNVVFADPTGFLEKQRSDLQYAHSFGDKYYELLSHTRVVVALMTGDIHGGTSTREAIVSGANPVLLRYPHYEDIVQDSSFYGWCTLEPKSIAAAVRQQMENTLDETVYNRVASESYQRAWPTVLKDIQCLLSR